MNRLANQRTLSDRLRRPWRPVAVGLFVVVACVATGRELAVELTRGSDLSMQRQEYERLAGLAARIPMDGPEVCVFAGIDMGFVGYSPDAEYLTTPYDTGMQDPDLRRRVDRAALRYSLAQQLLAPRILLLPVGPLFAKAQLIVGSYESVETVPDGAERGLEEIANLGNGIVLWRRR